MHDIQHRALALVAAILLSGCVAHQASLLKGTQGFVPGRDTAGLNPEAAREKVLHETAKIAIDHGYRYFILVAGTTLNPNNPELTRTLSFTKTPSADTVAITPGVPVRFRLTNGDEKWAQHLQRWDAYSLLQAAAHHTTQKSPYYSLAK